MYLFLFFIFLLAAFVWAAFDKPLKLSFLFDSGEMTAVLRMLWLPGMTAELRLNSSGTHLSVRIFGLTIIDKRIVQKKKKKLDLTTVKLISASNTRIAANYGLNDPYQTGLLHAILCFFGCFIAVDSLELMPNFVPANEHLRIAASSNLNMGSTAVRLFKSKLK